MKKYSRNTQILDSELDDQEIMLNIDKGKYYGLNPIGKRIWEIIIEPKNMDEIVNSLLLEYKVEPELCLREVNDFINKSINCGLIITHEDH